MAQYTQLRNGSWGIRIFGGARTGQVVTVIKKDGSAKNETIDKVLWEGPDNKTGQRVALCSIASSGNGRHSQSSKTHTQYGCKNGQCHCPHCSSGSECLCRCSCGFGG